MTLCRVSILSLFALLLFGAGPAGAYSGFYSSRFYGDVFFGEDKGACDDAFPPGCDTSDADDARDAFLAAVVDPLIEDFSSFDSRDDGKLDLCFEDPADLAPGFLTATLFDPTREQSGYIGTGSDEERGFAISGDEFWKNRTEEDGGLFSVHFDTAVRAFGFYATAYSTLSETGSTDLVLRLRLESGRTVFVPIDHFSKEKEGNVFFLGVLSDEPFIRATLLNQSDEDGDVIGFDDFTVAIVPEPATGGLLAAGLLALAGARRRSRARA